MSLTWKPVAVLVCWIVLANGGAAIAQEKKVEQTDDEKTQLNKALLVAAGDGKLAAVKELLKKGADIQFRDPGPVGKTPLVRAIQSGKLDVVKFLVESGADIFYPTRSDTYPVLYCCTLRNADILEYLLSKGGAKDFNRGPYRLLVALCGHGGSPEMIPVIIKAGCSPDVFQGDVTPLIRAIQYDPKGQRKELVRAYVKALIETKADVNLRDKGKEKMSPLQWAKQRGDSEIIDMLEKAGAKE